MRKSVLKLTSAVLIIVFALAMLPMAVMAAGETDAVILVKANGEKIIYIKGLEGTEFKYAFSDNDDASSAIYITATKDTNNEYVAFMENGQTYGNNMFVQHDGSTDTIKLDTLKSITEDEIKDVEKLTKIIGVKTDESQSTVSNNNGTTVTTTTGKIVVTDDGDYQYQLIEVLDKNNSTSKLNETAVELYEQLSNLSKAEKMYDKLMAEITIRDDYKKLLDDAKWEDAKNKEIPQPENSQEGEKFVVLIREVDGDATKRTDVQFMTCGREDAEGVEESEKEVTKTVEKKTKLPVTGENLALYIVFGVVILTIIILIVKMKKANKDEE